MKMGREVKKGGRTYQKSAGSSSPPKMGGGRSEFATDKAGTVASGMSKGRSEFKTERVN